MGPQRYFMRKSCHKWDNNNIFWESPVKDTTYTQRYVWKRPIFGPNNNIAIYRSHVCYGVAEPLLETSAVIKQKPGKLDTEWKKNRKKIEFLTCRSSAFNVSAELEFFHTWIRIPAAFYLPKIIINQWHTDRACTHTSLQILNPISHGGGVFRTPSFWRPPNS